jgi:hypothetical protein
MKVLLAEVFGLRSLEGPLAREQLVSENSQRIHVR